MITISSILAADESEDIDALLKKADKNIENMVKKNIEEQPTSPMKYVHVPLDTGGGLCYNALIGCK